MQFAKKEMIHLLSKALSFIRERQFIVCIEKKTTPKLETGPKRMGFSQGRSTSPWQSRILEAGPVYLSLMMMMMIKMMFVKIRF